MELFDTHAHYNDEEFDIDREEILQSICDSGVTKLINAGYSLDSSKKAVEIALKYDWVYATCGISPNDIPDTKKEIDNQILDIQKIILNHMQTESNVESVNNEAEKTRNGVNNSKKIVAIGEIGLDYHWNKKNKELQQYAFIKQIELANSLNLPIVIHTREAVNDTLDILKNRVEVIKKGVFHCCPLNQELIKSALKLGFYISFAGPITFRNSKNADEVIQIVPLNRMLIETDSPYLAPEPYRGKRNDSRNVQFIAKKIAEVKQMPIEEIAKQTYENTKEIFKIS